MTVDELQTKLSTMYSDVEFQVSTPIFRSHVVFAYIPSRDLYIDVLNSYPCMWCEDFDEELHDEPDDVITFSDEYINEVMLRNDCGRKRSTEMEQLDDWMANYDIPRAQLSNVKYVVFWDDQLNDAALWFALGCPYGYDCVYEYSWLPKRDLLDLPLPTFTGTPMNLSKIVKYFQFFEFYWRELAMWYNNDPYRSHGRLQGFLYANRYQYINKKPSELTTAEILRGFTISGILRGYTTFDAKLMYEVLDVHSDIESVYDPCAGWGERMLACYTKNILYTGVDVNPGLLPGYIGMIEQYDIKNALFINEDSSKYIPEKHHDAVITCPPYGDIEYYSDLGAENYSYDDFLKWWEIVVKNCCKADPKYFCFQINTKYRDPMLQIVENAGYTLIDELHFKSNKSSHFNRKKNGLNLKTEKESMLVLERTV